MNTILVFLGVILVFVFLHFLTRLVALHDWRDFDRAADKAIAALKNKKCS